MKHSRISYALQICTLFLCLLLPATALAGPAYNGVVTVTERATGRQVSIRNYGDEFFSFCTDVEGYLLVNNNGYYYYVREQNGQFALGERLTGANAANAPEGEDAKTRVKPGGSDFRNKLTALNETLSRAHVLEAAGLPAAPTQIPQDYYTRINSDGSLDAAKGYFNWEDARVGLDAPEKAATCPLLVLHLAFEDVQPAFDDTAWHKRIFDDGVANYYATVSNGTFRYTPMVESSGYINDGVITVKLPINAPRWARNDAANLTYGDGIMAGLYRGTDGQDYAIYNESSLFLYGMIAAQDSIDLASLDRNGDGYISPTEAAFVMVYSGYEASFKGSDDVMGKPAVWAHSWSSNCYLLTPDRKGETGTQGSFTIDGVRVYKYTLIGECTNGALSSGGGWTSPVQMQYGTVCHELGHDLGTMDLYNTLYVKGQYEMSLNVDALSVMAGGNWGHLPGAFPGSMPTHFDPFDKVFLGFYTPETINCSGLYTVNATEPSSAYKIWRINTADPDVYYLLENRRNTGYDRGLYYSYDDIVQKSGGVVLWRIDESKCRKYWNINELNAHEGAYAIMPVFHNNDSKLPFWGGNYYDLNTTTVLPIRDGVELRFSTASNDAMQFEVRYLPGSTPADVPDSTLADPVVVEKATDANGREVSLTRRTLPSQNEDYKDLRAQAGEHAVVFAAYEVNAGDYSNVSFPLSVSFHVGKSYAGETFTVLHKTKSGKIERYVVRIDENGKATVTVNELSPFMLLRGAQTEATSAVASIPETGGRDDAVLALLPLLLFCGYLVRNSLFFHEARRIRRIRSSFLN